MYVKNRAAVGHRNGDRRPPDDQIKGLCRLLSLCVRLLTLLEIVTRRHLKADGQTLAGLYEGNPNRQTATPTAKRLLRAFRGIDRVRLANKASPYTTPLNDLQRNLLSLLSINVSVYQQSLPVSNLLVNFGRRCGQLLAQLCYG